ncbi:hypothetical protein EPR50_G00084870 [Perca flavescens]|uniref:Uncharacterized protein n=1 Tax=Perca flavescens TaxID=8167 RepID=A0A484D1J8_PERFV|nr:hypothetical protein EPR50_G00084870 [Perca flavescens]
MFACLSVCLSVCVTLIQICHVQVSLCLCFRLKMAQRERTQINEEQRETLKTFFEDGMTRVGSPLISRAASDTGLETNVIENWIGNYKRSFKACSKPGPPKQKLYRRELSPYNLFCRDILKNKGTMNDIKGRWSTLREDVKKQYVQEAAALKAHGQTQDLSPEMRELKIKGQERSFLC